MSDTGSVATTNPVNSAAQSRLPTVLQVLIAMALLFVCSSAPALVWLYPGLADRADAAPAAGWPLALLWLSWLLPTAAALILVGIVARLDGRRSLSALGWRFDRRVLPVFVLGSVISILIVVIPTLILHGAGLLRPAEDAGLDDLPLWAVVISVVFRAVTLQAIPEELIFRGYLLRSLRFRPFTAIMISSAAFAILHLISSGDQQNIAERFVYLLLPFGFAVAAATLSIRVNSLWAAVGIHAGMHFALPITSALGDGPWLWCVSGLLWTAVGLLIWRSTPADHTRRWAGRSQNRAGSV